MVCFQGIGWRMPGMAIEAAREGWRLTTRTESFQQDARELLPVYSNETCRGFCPGFFLPFFGAFRQELSSPTGWTVILARPVVLRNGAYHADKPHLNGVRVASGRVRHGYCMVTAKRGKRITSPGTAADKVCCPFY